MTDIPVDQIYQTLRDEIIELKCRPGDALSENSLARRFGISRTPIRAVLQRLENEHLVRIVPQKETTVTRIHHRLAAENIYGRIAIETFVLRDFIKCARESDIRRVSDALRLMHNAARYSGRPDFDYNAFLKLDLNMHAIWFETMNLKELWQTITAPSADYSRFIRLDIIKGNNAEATLRDHDEMLRIIREKDYEAIEPLMRRHLTGGMRRLTAQLLTDYSDYLE